MGASYNKEGDPISYHRDRDEPVGSSAFTKIDPYEAGRDYGDESLHRTREAFTSRPVCEIQVENARPDNFNETLQEAKLRDEQARIVCEDHYHSSYEEYAASARTSTVSRYPSTLKDLIFFVQRFFGKGIDTIREKNQRYAGDEDPFLNFRLGGQYGIAIRMSDKVSRLITLLKPGQKLDGLDESIEDTCMDLANYCAILSAMRQNERGK